MGEEDAAAVVLLAVCHRADAGEPGRVRAGVRHLPRVHMVVCASHLTQWRLLWRRRRRGRASGRPGRHEDVHGEKEGRLAGRRCHTPRKVASAPACTRWLGRPKGSEADWSACS